MVGAGGSEMDVVEEDASGGYLPPNPAIEPPPSLFVAGDDEDDDEDDSDVSSPRRPSTSLGPGRRNRSESRASAHSAGPHSSPDRSLAQRRASTAGAEEGMGGQTRKKRNRPSTGRAPGRPKDDLISKLAVMKEDTGRLHCIAVRCARFGALEFRQMSHSDPLLFVVPAGALHSDLVLENSAPHQAPRVHLPSPAHRHPDPRSRSLRSCQKEGRRAQGHQGGSELCRPE